MKLRSQKLAKCIICDVLIINTVWLPLVSGNYVWIWYMHIPVSCIMSKSIGPHQFSTSITATAAKCNHDIRSHFVLLWESHKVACSSFKNVHIFWMDWFLVWFLKCFFLNASHFWASVCNSPLIHQAINELKDSVCFPRVLDVEKCFHTFIGSTGWTLNSQSKALSYIM